MTPKLFVLIFICTLFNSKIRENFYNAKSTIRSASIKRFKSTKRVLLFHAASAGEFEQLKPIIQKIDRKKYFIIQSFTSSTIFNQEKNTKLVDAVCYQPYDIKWLSKFFFKSLKPDKYIITRHDIWPNHVLTASHMDISCILINANIHNNSIWMYTIFHSFSKKIFDCFNFILVPSESIKHNLDQLNLTSKIQIVEDSRYIQIINRYNMNKNKKFLPDSFKKSNNLIFGSIDIDDEKIIFKTLKKLYPNGDTDLKNKNTKIILVPHEIDKHTINRLSQTLRINNFSYSLFTKLSNNNENAVLIVDIIGALADLYQYSKVAYVGGGFSRGVHSVIEPAVYNTYIGFGPKIEMLNEAKELLENNFAKKIYDSKDMYDFLNLNYDDKQSSNLYNFIANKAKASENIIQFFLK